MSEPLITIGITCYDEGDWLLECWESVLSQTDRRWVAVLVMDATEHQGTREIFEELEHPRLRKYAMPTRMGPYPVRNKAFELTETPYHFYLDGDDQLVPESVAVVLESFAKHPEAGFVYGDYECFGSRSDILRFPSEVTKGDFVRTQPTPGPCAYAKRVWEQLGGFASELALGNADYDFLIGAAEAGIKGYHCGQVLYRYRVRGKSVSSSYEQRYHQTHEIIVRRHPLFFSDPRLRSSFLALGYKRAAQANHAAGDLKQASKLALAALRHGMQDHELWSLALQGKMPAWTCRGLHRACRFGARSLRKWRSSIRSEDNGF